MTETVTDRQPEDLFELLEAVRYAEAHDQAVVVIRNGKVEIERRTANRD